MKLQEIFDDLVYGELSAHAIAMGGTIQDKDKPRVIAQINIALTELYTRFPLLMKEVTLIQQAGITDYYLTVEHAQSDTTDPNILKYIKDIPGEKFTGDVLRVDNVYDENNDELYLNAYSPCKVAFTPSVNCLQIPNPTDSNALFVIYRARHPVVTDATTDLLLPENFRAALLAFVASRIYSGGTSADHATLSATLLQKFELICLQQEQFGMVNKDIMYIGDKLDQEGWV